MKLGFISVIVPEFSFEELIDFASDNGFECVEVCCWPVGKVERRYAGVTHLDVDELCDDDASAINNYLKMKKVEISVLNDIRYSGPVCIEVEDKAFENSFEERKEALQLSKRFLSQYL